MTARDADSAGLAGPLVVAYDDVQSTEGPVFHPCPVDPDCPHCGNNAGAAATALDWSFIDAAYCISLKTREDRVAQSAAEFHRSGLCRHTLFYRPTKHPLKGIIGSWESHRAVAQAGIARGAKRILVFEDDVLFTRQVTARDLADIRTALDGLPSDWQLFHLGHWPLRAWPVARKVLKTSSACAHAYVASARLMQWLDARPWGTPGIAMRPIVGKALDAAFAALPGTYALFPMIAIQRVSRSDNFNLRGKPIKKAKHLVTRTRYRESLLSGSMRPAEVIVVGLSPMFYLIDRWRRWIRTTPEK
jgi:GR25 family glycosyltransferase involved in LPS biosynthesis